MGEKYFFSGESKSETGKSGSVSSVDKQTLIGNYE